MVDRQHRQRGPWGKRFRALQFREDCDEPRIFKNPDPLNDALQFVETIRNQPGCVLIAPSSTHWSIFTDLCRQSGAMGNLVPDAYLAALAIESGSEWITTDQDYAKFPGLRWRHPF